MTEAVEEAWSCWRIASIMYTSDDYKLKSSRNRMIAGEYMERWYYQCCKARGRSAEPPHVLVQCFLLCRRELSEFYAGIC